MQILIVRYHACIATTEKQLGYPTELDELTFAFTSATAAMRLCPWCHAIAIVALSAEVLRWDPRAPGQSFSTALGDPKICQLMG